ncbi:MAG: hypothetical protein Q8P69_02225 [bacterium]|nr:hypothetical protein [bacterium]
MLAFTKKELETMKRLNTPAKTQDFLNRIPINFEKDGVDRVKSPIMVLRDKSAHCIEAAILGAYILSLHGHPPLLLHLASTKEDMDHVIAPFKTKGYWGALSKGNHVTLRYRDPVYKTIRELAMSFFNEYYLENGAKTMRSYSRPLDLNIFGSHWMVQDEDLWDIDQKLDKIKHFDIAPKEIIRKLRKADKIERRALDITDWKE